MFMMMMKCVAIPVSKNGSDRIVIK